VSASHTVALVTTPCADAGVEEFLRILVGLLAGGASISLLEIGAGVGLLSEGPQLSAKGARHLEALADCGVWPTPVGPARLREVLSRSTRLLRIAGASRSGRPPLLQIGVSYLRRVSDQTLLSDLGAAGQVLLEAARQRPPDNGGEGPR